ncbi:3676_t:CDS:2 [Ambispora leptoticha]|uniref:3676_t:CDS:1 n=1 Tax=Ambispora leptoticha TaxID=144679 RepID=A0A9N8YSH9_9GLOM|nr:3676_t:CDS:2 [Ambispora leptoticha]
MYGIVSTDNQAVSDNNSEGKMDVLNSLSPSPLPMNKAILSRDDYQGQIKWMFSRQIDKRRIEISSLHEGISIYGCVGIASPKHAHTAQSDPSWKETTYCLNDTIECVHPRCPVITTRGRDANAAANIALSEHLLF